MFQVNLVLWFYVIFYFQFLNDEIIGNFVPCLLNVVKNELSQYGIKENFGDPLKDLVNENVSTALDTASTMAKSMYPANSLICVFPRESVFSYDISTDTSISGEKSV